MSNEREVTVPTISNDGRGASYFGQRHITLSGDFTRQLSDPIDAVNFRLRHSDGYSSDYHVAGDPTLLIVLSGSMRIDLQNGDSKTFTQGELYIAEDYLEPDVKFNPTLHGHRAVMTENMPYKAVHIKLEKRKA